MIRLLRLLAGRCRRLPVGLAEFLEYLARTELVREGRLWPATEPGTLDRRLVEAARDGPGP